MNLLDLKLLVVIFAPGTGGNHLCNMLSLSDSLHRLCPVDCYVDVLTTKYLNITPELDAAHFKSAIVIHPAAQRPFEQRIKIINEDAGPLWRRLSTDLNLKLPVADCNNIHSIWYSKFFK